MNKIKEVKGLKPKCSICGKSSRINSLPAGWKLVCKSCDAAQTNLSNLKPEHQKFVQNVASGMNQTEAYRDAYPKASYETAMVNSSLLLRNTKISEALQNRVHRNLAHAQTSHDEVIGSAVRQMRSSIDDVLDENGFFDLEKARETGGIDFVKKLKVTEKTVPATNTTERVCEIEMYSSAEGRREVANYTGLEKSPRPPAESMSDEEIARELYRRLTEVHKRGADETIDAIERKFPHLDVGKILASQNNI